ncbi:MAG: L-lysine 6-transaminase [Acidobacteriia bacterium]|nr:L-lysine 6-transaminase [Terriglobia bacterium]
MNYPAERVFDALKKHILVDGFHVIVDLQKSHGSYIVDAANGKEYLDFYSYFASLPIGHNHPKLLNDEHFLEALRWAAIANPANSDIYCKEYAAFVEQFASYVKPAHMKYMFFVAGGALAIENALKTAFDWKVRKNMKKGIRGEKGQQVIHFREAFHGRTGYTMSLTNTDPVKTDYYPKFNWPRIINPKLTFPITDQVIRDVEKVEQEAVRQIKAAIRENKDDIACLVIESIQGEGGDNHFRKEFFQQLRQLADENEFLFICDEIQSGMGITGKLWAYEHFDVKPDIIAFGKKAQICGIMVTDRIDDVENHVFRKSSRINSTWGGNLTDMIRGAKYAEIIMEDGLIENARDVGKVFLERLDDLSRMSGGKITNVRGRGLFIAYDMTDGKTRDQFRTRCWENGLATLSSGTRSVRFRGCLNVTRTEVDRAMSLIEKSL